MVNGSIPTQHLNMTYMAGLVHLINFLLGTFFNTLVIYLAAKQTSKDFRAYSMLILSSAVCSLCSSWADILTIQRMIPRDLSLFYMSYGPCRLSGTTTCFVVFSFLLHSHIFNLYLTLLSFVFRHYVLSHSAPKVYTTLLVIFIFYIPCFVQLIAYSLSSDPEPIVRGELQKYFSYDTKDSCASGHHSILKFGVLYMAVHIVMPIIPVYTIILVLRRRIVTKLSTMNAMSEKTRQMHSMLLKAIVYQACIPCFYLLTAATYVVGQLDIIHHPFVEITSLTFVCFMPVLTPLGSLYFIKPYRAWVLENILKRKPKLTTKAVAFTSTNAGT